MYLRFVQLKLMQEHLFEARKNYEEKVIPILQNVKGCMYASLVQSTHHADEYISMTLWDKREDAEMYERSGVFKQLWDEGKRFLCDSSEWKITLSEDFTVAYEPIVEEPAVSAYEIPASNSSSIIPESSFGSLFVRIVSPQICEGKMEEFRKIYETEIKPEIQKAKGCKYVYLTGSMKNPDQVISLTIWNSKEDAETYERSGVFTQLIKKVEHTFSEMHQWKMQLAKETHGRIVTSEEMIVDGYSVVTGKSFL
jgi:heme-degrading monooxygenase HmoA